ncbi:MAG: OadG family protein [Candidatus Cloacimonetes bacterium]|nr:OadG family protein [Candidatus Cloacimonadota bacterium]
MKKVIILLMIVFTLTCFAKDKKLNFPPSSTLLEVSAQTNIPVKKIAQYLKLEDQTEFNVTLQKLGISNEDLEKAFAEYHNNKVSFYTGIILVGMGIVFVSLLLVGFIINSLQHVGERKKKTVVQTSVGKVTAPRDHISSDGIVAAITAMFLHDAEERDKIDLTWKRQTISLWQAAGMVENRVFEDRRGRK